MSSPPEAEPAVLAYRALGLGDLLTALPTLRALRQGFPGQRLAVATPEALHPLLLLAGCADETVPAAPLAPFEWEGPGPAVAVNLHGSGPESHQLLRRLAPGRLVAFACPELGHDGPAWQNDEPEIDRWARLVEEGLGLPVDRDDRYLDAPYTLRPGVVVVHPGSSDPARRWPAERFGAAARRLSRSGSDVVVTGSDEETDLVNRVVAEAGLPPDAAIAGKLDIVALTALVASARAVLSNDTGVGHLATALRTPSVLLFGPTPPHLWGPPPQARHVVIHRRGVAARDLDVDPGEVAAAVLEAAMVSDDPYEGFTHTTDRKQIRWWAEARDGRPILVPQSRHPAEVAVPSLAFAGERVGVETAPATWDEWFEHFEDDRLCLRYREYEPDGSASHWFQVHRRTDPH